MLGIINAFYISISGLILDENEVCFDTASCQFHHKYEQRTKRPGMAFRESDFLLSFRRKAQLIAKPRHRRFR